LAKEFPEATKGWAVLSLSPEGIRRERREEGKGVSLSSVYSKRQGKRLAKSTLLFAAFSFKEKVGEMEVRSRSLVLKRPITI